MKPFSDLPESGSRESETATALAGILAITIEQAVAAPYASSRLAEAGARAIKIEKPPADDFARHYNAVVHGESAHFVWLYSTKPDRVRNRETLNEVIRKAIATTSEEKFFARLKHANIAYGIIRSVEELLHHPALSVSEMDTPTGPVRLPHRAIPRTNSTERKTVPALGSHTESIRREFAPGVVPTDSQSVRNPT